MANDKNGLFLPLKINLADWEKDLATASSDLQQKMREMHAAVKDLKLQYDVKIAGARSAGDELKALELESEKLNRVLETQKDVVERLNRVYAESVKEKGEDAEASKALARQLVNESRQLERVQAQINKKAIAEQQRQEAEQQKLQAEEQRKQQQMLAEQQRQAQQLAQVKEKFNRELRDTGVSGYQKEINAIKDKRDAYIRAGLSEVEANKLYAKQKSEIDKRYADQAIAEQKRKQQEATKLAQKEVADAKRLADEVTNRRNRAKEDLLSGALMTISPKIEGYRRMLNGLTSSLNDLGGVAINIGKSLAKVAIPAGIITAGVVGIKRLVDSYKETAVASAEANEEVYQLREVLNSSYKEAELLAGAARVDGVNLQSLGAAVNTLYKNIDLGNEKGKRAVAVLEQYGAAITDINGNRKDTISFFRELQNAFANAESMGRGRDFLTSLFGGSSDQFLHFIKGFDYYIAKAEEVLAVNEKEYQLSHDLLDLRKQQQEAERQLQAVRGDAFVAGAVEAQKLHNAGVKEQISLYEEAKSKLAGYSEEMRNLALAEEGALLAWERFKIALQTQGMQVLDNTWKKLKDIAEAYKNMQGFSSIPKWLQNTPVGSIFGGIDAFLSGVNGISDEEKKVAERTAHDAYMAEVDAISKAIDEEDRIKEQKARDEVARQKKEAEANKKSLEEQKNAQEQFYRELRDLRSDDYQKELNHLEDRKQAWLKANVDIVDIERRYNEEKAQIDKKYYEKAEKERQENLKKETDAYKKQIEEAKKARESQISDAQSTIQNAAKVLKYIQQQQKAGTYNEENVKAYADKLALKSSGVNQSQIDTAYSIGIDKLKELMDSKTRLYGRFADAGGANSLVSNLIGFNQQQQQQRIPQAQQVQQAPININLTFDNIVVEDEGSIQRLADRVADTITPVIEQALQGGAQYGY